jgi:hypothetical protein
MGDSIGDREKIGIVDRNRLWIAPGDKFGYFIEDFGNRESLAWV